MLTIGRGHTLSQSFISEKPSRRPDARTPRRIDRLQKEELLARLPAPSGAPSLVDGRYSSEVASLDCCPTLFFHSQQETIRSMIRLFISGLTAYWRLRSGGPGHP